ncbi:MAG TPA: SUMF1/EgtB/PvdO family nonheme iron enzyme [Polyangiaceae bacterium]
MRVSARWSWLLLQGLAIVAGVSCGSSSDDPSETGGTSGVGGGGSAGKGGAGAGKGGTKAGGGTSNGGTAGSAGAGRGGSGNGKGGTASAGDAGDGGATEGGTGGSAGGAGVPNEGGAAGAAEAGGTAGASGGTAGASGGDAGGAGEAGAGGAPCVTGSVSSPGPSCTGLAATCGDGGASDCCAAARMSGGEFLRSNDERYPATVCPYSLDLYEVTVGRFRKFVEAYPGNTPAAGSGRNANDEADPGWDAAWNANLPVDRAALESQVKCGYPVWTDTPGANETRPMTCLTWYVAFAFCVWDGGRLPTEAEWNFAAAGGDEQRYYPWSNPPGDMTIGEAHASYYVDDTQQCRGDGVDGCQVTDFVPAGSKAAGAGRFGHTDLAGNVWEWTSDYWGGYPNSCDDCMNLEPSTLRMVRGGGIDTGPTEVWTGYRDNGTLPHHVDAWTGARCARLAGPP